MLYKHKKQLQQPENCSIFPYVLLKGFIQLQIDLSKPENIGEARLRVAEFKSLEKYICIPIRRIYKVNKTKLLKGAGIVAITAMLPLSQVALADSGGDNWGISGWINQGLTYADDGTGSDIVSVADNGNTLGSRMTLAGSTELPNSGLTAGFDVTLEFLNGGQLGFGTVGTGNINGGTFDEDNGDILNVLGHSAFISGGFGKLTFGLQSMPTDNIAVLEDPSLTLWASISPVFRGNGVIIQNGNANNTTGSSFGDFMNCYTNSALRGNLGIGIDCNGTYLQGVRYDLPAFGPVTVAVGLANDDRYDIAAKYKGDIGGVKAQLAIGYAINQSATNDSSTGTATVIGTESENFQVQAGLMDPGTGIFGSIAYQSEDNDNTAAATVGGISLQDTDAYWLKVGIKKAFNSYGDTSFAFQYGSYNDQFGLAELTAGVTGSEVERIGFEVNQYFGSRLIVYGVWENLSVDVDGTTAAVTNLNGGDDLDTFTAGLTFFF